jgi:hypothetical protein
MTVALRVTTTSVALGAPLKITSKISLQVVLRHATRAITASAVKMSAISLIIGRHHP